MGKCEKIGNIEGLTMGRKLIIGTCPICEEKKVLHIHHISYKPEIIKWLCQPCHNYIHHSKEGRNKYRMLLIQTKDESKDGWGYNPYAWYVLKKRELERTIGKPNLYGVGVSEQALIRLSHYTDILIKLNQPVGISQQVIVDKLEEFCNENLLYEE